MERIFENKNWKIEIGDNDVIYLTKKFGNKDIQVIIISPNDKIISFKNVFLIGDLFSIKQIEKGLTH